MKWAFWLVGTLGIGIVGYGLYMRRIDPPTVISEGQIDVSNPKDSTTKFAFRIRTVKGGGITAEQVELPGGTWMDCGGDCRDTIHKATTDFWEEQRKKK